MHFRHKNINGTNNCNVDTEFSTHVVNINILLVIVMINLLLDKPNVLFLYLFEPNKFVIYIYGKVICLKKIEEITQGDLTKYIIRYENSFCVLSCVMFMQYNSTHADSQ